MQTRVVVVFVALMLAAGVVARADRYEQPPPRTAFEAFPMQMGDWRGVQDPPLSKEVLNVLRADDYVTRTYFTPDRSVAGLYIGYWQSQRQGDTIHSPLNCLPGSGWEFVSQTTRTFRDPRNPAGPDLAINRNVIQKGMDRQLVLYWYQSHGRIVASEYWSKLYLIGDAVRLNRTDGSIVRVITRIHGETAEAEQAAERDAMKFVTVLLPQLEGFLPD
jgi:EpsI family protein